MSETQLLSGAYAQAVELSKREHGVTALELCAERGKNPKGLGGFLLVFRYLQQQGWITESGEERWGSKVYYFAPSGHTLVRARRRKREAERKQKAKDREKAFFAKMKTPTKIRRREQRESKILTPYQTFLKSDYWREVRDMVLARDGHKCVRCESENALQIHHRTYEHHGREKEYLDDLETLCELCHKAGHGLL